MADVHQLPEGITRRKCPGCGHLILQKLVEKAARDFACPRCGKHRLGEFTPHDTPPTSPKPRKALKRAA